MTPLRKKLSQTRFYQATPLPHPNLELGPISPNSAGPTRKIDPIMRDNREADWRPPKRSDAIVSEKKKKAGNWQSY